MTQNVPQNLLESYVVANTPAYLFKSFSSDNYLQRLIHEDKNQLLDFVKDIGSKTRLDLQDVAWAYCVLIAFFNSESATESEMFAAAEMSRLPWAMPILALAKARRRKNNIVNLTVPEIRDSNLMGTNSASSFNIVNFGK